ncbi:MAG: DEAD/DEAH box helicase, partial [Deltaproteobacteria bacterium]|nr:DEAD/DEAH box helicase [Deltaproteobacteria bacterium]
MTEIDTPDSAAAPGCAADQSQVPSGSFDEFGLAGPVRQGIAALGYRGPTPVQRVALRPILDGRDIIVQAKTGSGKTSAFGIPIVAALARPQPRPRALVLCPARELALQVAAELSTLANPSGLRVCPIYGGVAFGPQLSALKRGVDIVVGTPGRLLDHLRRHTLDVGAVCYSVLDEADEMFSMGFWEQVTALLDALKAPHQTLLFSATLPPEVARTAARYLHQPERIELSADEITVAGIANVYYDADDRLPKPRNMLHVIEVERPESAIVFCNRRDETELVYNVLRRFGFAAGVLNSDRSQREREQVMAAIKRGDIKLLVATDVAARGIDIADLTHIFNYDLPDFSEVYVHRAGRTGRVGKRGTAVSLIRGRSNARLKEISSRYEIAFEERTLPAPEQIVELQVQRIVQQLLEQARAVEISQYRPVAEALLRRDDASEAIAFLLGSHFSSGSSARAGRDRPPQRLRLDIGSADGLDEARLVELLAARAEIPAEAIEVLALDERECQIAVNSELADQLRERIGAAPSD